MELDDLKQALENEKMSASKVDHDSLSEITLNVGKFDKALKRNNLVEYSVSIFALFLVIVMLFAGPHFYPKIISELLPELSNGTPPKINAFMYSSMILMALYCIFVPIKLYLSNQTEDSLNWQLNARVDSEINKLEKRNKLWSTAHIWSLAPAALIGILFFWGLHHSLLGTWIPNIYLSSYFVFLLFSTAAGLWLKNNLLEQEIRPLLNKLYQLKKDLNDAITE